MSTFDRFFRKIKSELGGILDGDLTGTLTGIFDRLGSKADAFIDSLDVDQLANLIDTPKLNEMLREFEELQGKRDDPNWLRQKLDEFNRRRGEEAARRKAGAGPRRPASSSSSSSSSGSGRRPAEPERPADAWQTLGLARGASLSQVKAAYHKLAKRYHPDKLGKLPEGERKAALKKMQAVNDAYAELKKTVRR